MLKCVTMRKIRVFDALGNLRLRFPKIGGEAMKQDGKCITEKKFKFTDRTQEFRGVELHQIVALKDFYVQTPSEADSLGFHFGLVRKGTLGGWLECEENLSQNGFCWVGGNAHVLNGAEVMEGGLVCGEACVSDGARVTQLARVSGSAAVINDAVVKGSAIVSGDATITAHSVVFDNARVKGRAIVRETKVFDNANVSEGIIQNSFVGGNAFIYLDYGTLEKVYLASEATIFSPRDHFMAELQRPVNNLGLIPRFWATMHDQIELCLCSGGIARPVRCYKFLVNGGTKFLRELLMCTMRSWHEFAVADEEARTKFVDEVLEAAKAAQAHFAIREVLYNSATDTNRAVKFS